MESVNWGEKKIIISNEISIIKVYKHKRKRNNKGLISLNISKIISYRWAQRLKRLSFVKSDFSIKVSFKYL